MSAAPLLAPPAGPPSVAAAWSVAPPAAPGVHLGEVLAALSRALDLTEGQPAGHTLRSCAIAMRLADALALDEGRREALYYAMLLKDAGCSSNAARMAALFGADDRWVKPRMKAVDWHRRVRLAVATLRTVGRGLPLRERWRHVVGITQTPDMTRELMLVRCERGAAIARGLGFGDEVAEAIRCLDEHWCGAGYPDGLAGTAIPLLARIANLAQAVETVHAEHGLAAALRVARRRRGTWFDPALVDVLHRALGRDRAWWRALGAGVVEDEVAAGVPPGRTRGVADAELDAVAAAFAEIIDAKSPFTYRHSFNVADWARRILATLGDDAEAQRRLHRAGLLHDVGKLGVSNRILDKNGPLTPEERTEVARHPLYTWDILARVGAFRDFAWTAATHHEKLDGSGYPWGLSAPELDRPARVLAVADIWEALTADRPYRAGMPPERALAILEKERGTGLCPDAVDALTVCVTRDA